MEQQLTTESYGMCWNKNDNNTDLRKNKNTTKTHYIEVECSYTL